MTKPLTPAQKAARAAKRANKPAAPSQASRAIPVKDDPKLANALDQMNQAGQQAQQRRQAEPMPGNDSTMHAGVHDTHDMDQTYDDQVHGADQFPENWIPPAELDAPPPMPGMVQRWVRMSLKGQNDGNNLASMARQGWRPRALESVPEGIRKNYSTMKDPRSSGMFLVNKDVVLCEMPKRLFDQMSEYYRKQRVGQVASLVDKPLSESAIKGAENHGFGAPHVEHRSTNVRTDRVAIVRAD